MAELARLRIFDTAPEVEFDQLARLAASIFSCDFAFLSFVNSTHQCLKASVGLEGCNPDRGESFCAHTILVEEKVMWIEDARRDIRFSTSEAVLGPMRLRFYAGAPIVVRGMRIGAMCVASSEPRRFDSRLADQLGQLADMASERILSRARRDDSLEVKQALQAGVRRPVLELDGMAECLTTTPPAWRHEPFDLSRSASHQQDEHHYKLLVDEISDYAIYMLDTEGRVASWNNGARAIKGYDQTEIIGKSLSTFYTLEDREAKVHQTALTIARTNGRYVGEGWRVRKDGSRLWASVVIQPIYDGEQFVGFAKITRDVTDRYQSGLALEAALEEAKQASEAKTAFLANMSHEIRTPLNGVLAIADVLRRSALEPKDAEMVDIIASSGRNLERLLGDILDLAKVESGRIQILPEPMDLNEMVASAAALIRLKAEEKGLWFETESQLDTQCWVLCDKLRLNQIINNLLSNAVKFTESGGVSMRVSAAAHPSGATLRLRVDIVDTGVGFHNTDDQRIFARFSQADGSITRRFGGSGLGLTISRQLAEMMGGTLLCESEPGEGSTFTLTIEVPVCAATITPYQTEVPQACTSDRQLKVLVVDDHATNRKVCELILAQIDAQVSTAENGAQAVEAYLTDPFDVILMDMQMPVMDGLTATRRIRSHELAYGAPRTPIYMLTANALDEHVKLSLDAGADCHIAKPLTVASLFAALELLPDSSQSAHAA